jgi:hypothetical protein
MMPPSPPSPPPPGLPPAQRQLPEQHGGSFPPHLAPWGEQLPPSPELPQTPLGGFEQRPQVPLLPRPGRLHVA